MLKEPIFFLDRRWAEELSVGREVRLDGPYGKGIDVSKYETVLLAADGIGISGILPFVLSLAVRYERDKDDKSQGVRGGLFSDEFRKVNIYWELGSEGVALGKMVVQLLEQVTDKKAAKVRNSPPVDYFSAKRFRNSLSGFSLASGSNPSYLKKDG